MNRRLIHLISVVLLCVGSGSVAWGQANQVLNPEFDTGLTSWGRYGTVGYTASVVTGAHLSGPNAALMDVTDASVASIGLSQGGLKFERGKKYPVGFMAKADKPREMVLLIQLAKPEVPSWTDIVLQHVSLTTEPQTFLFEYTHNDDNTADHAGWAATLYLMAKGQWWPMTGDTVPSKIWVDRVHVGTPPALADSTIRTAQAPQPAHGATDVPRDVVLTWTPGDTAGTHDVYFSKTSADVNTASRSSPKGVLASQGQATIGYTSKDPLEYGQTYYWRIDEVNKTPDNTIFKGSVWSFTVEPYAYPIPGTSITATASSAQPGLGPENTINGSGLTGDLHGNVDTTMWMTLGTLPNWIQYQFDAVYRLDKLLVWNCNQMVEMYVGFGAKDVTVEYSVDGTTWTKLPGVPQFAQASGLPGYAANTTVDFGGLPAKYVKLTINKSWGGLPNTGLSEVRFSYIPLLVRAPQPATGSTGAPLSTVLSWRPGREATSHKVYLGTDPNAVAKGTVAAQTVTDHSCTPASLNLGTVYYWRVDEVGANGTYAGPVWSFTTQDYLVVEDFESYNDDSRRIYDFWLDGFDNPSANGGIVGDNPTAAQLAAGTGHFAETAIVHGDKQSMPFAFDNTKAPLSEGTLTLDQNWTTNGVKSLSLWFRGVAGNKGQLYVKINKVVKVAYTGAGGDIALATWQPWNIDLSGVAGLNKVTSLTIGVEGTGAKGTLYIDDIRLYPKLPQSIVPVQPDQTNLVARYTFDGNFKDSVGTHHGTGTGDAKLTNDAVRGQVAAFDGNGDWVNVPYGADLNPAAFTVSLWAYPDAAGAADVYHSPLTSRDDTPQRGYVLYIVPTSNTWQFWTGTGTTWDQTAGPAAQMGAWAHVTAIYANGQKKLYLNGRLVAQSTAAAPLTLNTAQPLRIGAGASEKPAGDYYWRGMIDDVRIYNRALSDAEVLGVSGRTEPLAVPF